MSVYLRSKAECGVASNANVGVLKAITICSTLKQSICKPKPTLRNIFTDVCVESMFWALLSIVIRLKTANNISFSSKCFYLNF